MIEAGKHMPLPAAKPKIPEVEPKAEPKTDTKTDAKADTKSDDGKGKPNAGKVEDEVKPAKRSRRQAGPSRSRSPRS